MLPWYISLADEIKFDFNVGAIHAFARVEMNEKLKRRVMGVGYRAAVLLLRHRSMRRIIASLEAQSGITPQ